jgi:serine protease
MLRRLPAAVMAALFIFGAIAAPAPARASATQAPVAPEPFDSLTVRFAYNTTVGTAVSDDGKTREIQLRPGQDAETALAAWEQAPGVVGVIPDMQAFPVIDPIDPRYTEQWDMHAPTTGKEGAANVSPTWGTTTGAGVVVAVIDTGQTNHPDLIANMPEGWGVDMIENSATARDGDGRDMNPTDEGDWSWYPSSWHGTHVAGTIGRRRTTSASVALHRTCRFNMCAYLARVAAHSTMSLMAFVGLLVSPQVGTAVRGVPSGLQTTRIRPTSSTCHSVAVAPAGQRCKMRSRKHVPLAPSSLRRRETVSATRQTSRQPTATTR